MSQSVLNTVKVGLGLTHDYEVFDAQILLYLNAELTTLKQVGVPLNIVEVEDETVEWDQFGLDSETLALVKAYLSVKVKRLFDPPGTSFLLESMTKVLEEQEWRLRALGEELA